MRALIICVGATSLLLGGCATNRGWYHGDQRFATKEECLIAKNHGSGRSEGGTQGTAATVGAAGGATSALIAGGNLGQAAVAAGAGAATGALIGKRAC